MLPIVITVIVILGVLAVVYALGSRPSETATKRPTRGATSSKASRRGPAPRSSFRQAPAWLRRLPLVLVIAAVACLVAAVAQFRVAQNQGVPTVALVLDASNSMDAEDVTPNRLVAAQGAAQVFLQQLPEDFQVVLVSFADRSSVLAAATDDHEAVAAALADLPRGKGTVIGDGLSTALEQIEIAQAGGEPAPAAIVLLSDGRDTGSVIPPEEAAVTAASREIPVYTVVLGTTEGTGGANAALLDQIATTTGGSLSTADTAGELSGVYEGLGSQLSSQLQIGNSAQFFVIAGIVLAMAAAVITLALSLRKDA